MLLNWVKCPYGHCLSRGSDEGGLFFTIDCNVAEDGLRTTPGSQCALDALAIDEPLEYARLYLDGNIQMWVDAEDSLEIW